MKRISSMLPAWVKNFLKYVRDAMRLVPYYGIGMLCPVCNKTSRRFREYGVVPRENAQCIHCGALERHRLLWLFVTTRTSLFNGKVKKMLHVAPESCIESRLKQRLGDSYLTADLTDVGAMVKMDITNIEYPDQSFDAIYCSHVLEHVQDDKKAIREFYRVLKNDGWAILLVPITAEQTFENPLIVDPGERLKFFGQADHVRKYGPDYIDRLREAGFSVEVSRVNDLVESDEAIRMGLTSDAGEIYYCTK